MRLLLALFILGLAQTSYGAMGNFISASQSLVTYTNRLWSYSNTLGFSAGGWFWVTNDGLGFGGTLLSKSKGPASPDGWTLNFRTTGARVLQFQYNRNGTALLVATGTNALPLRQWCHVAVTYDRTIGSGNTTNSIKLYTNGVENTSRTQLQTGALASNDDEDAAFRVCSSQSVSAPDILRCNYDEVFFVTNVLAPLQIFEIYRMTKHMKQSLIRYLGDDLQVYYSCDYAPYGRPVRTNDSGTELTGTMRGALWNGWNQYGIGSFRTYP